MKLSVRISSIILVVTLAGMTALWLIISQNVSSIVEGNISNQMNDAVTSRAAIIQDYVSGTENTMVEFSLASEVKNLLKNPEDPEAVAAAQAYTEKYGAVEGIFEGLYIATPDSHVLTHTNPNVVGIYTRKGDSLESLQKDILSKRQVINAGIMMSKGSSNAMVMSLYYPIYENDVCIGFVGSAVYADRLMESIANLEIKGLPNKEYIFLNAADSTYIYNQDSTLINTVSEDKGCLDIIETVKSGKTDTTGTYSYTDNDGISYLAVYNYMSDRNWIFMVKDKYSEVFNSVNSVNLIVTAVCVPFSIILVAITLILMGSVRRELTTVKKSIEGIGRLELDAAKLTEKYTGRKDEVGKISDALSKLSVTLKNAVNDIGRIIGEMSEGNLTVDVAQNKDYYIGDFKALANSLEKLNQLNSSLVELMRNITEAAEQVHTGSGQVATGSSYLSSAAIEQTASIELLAQNIHEIEGQASSNSVSCSDVVSRTAESMSLLNDCIIKVKSIVETIADSSNKQTQMVNKIDDDISKIAGTVQANSATAEESAAVSEQLSGQAGMLKDLVSKFNF